MLFIIILRCSIYLIAHTTFKAFISSIYAMKLLGIIVMSKMTMLIILNSEHKYILKQDAR